MPKELLKERAFNDQQGKSAISGELLPGEQRLNDIHRLLPKHQGGTYSEGNYELITPREHMEHHGILREREIWLEHLKSLMDERFQAMKSHQKVENQLGAFERRTDTPNPRIVAQLTAAMVPSAEWIKNIDKEIVKHFKTATDPFVNILLNVPGVGPITAAFMLVYVDITKAEHPSSLWKYVGLHCASHERYTKGEAGGGNKTLRTALYNMACSMMKNKANPYRQVYDRTKARLEVSEKIVKSRNTQGKLVEVAWKDAKPCHRHSAAIRAIMKHFLADYWMVCRAVNGLPTNGGLYVDDRLGHTGIIAPAERGWNS